MQQAIALFSQLFPAPTNAGLVWPSDVLALLGASVGWAALFAIFSLLVGPPVARLFPLIAGKSLSKTSASHNQAQLKVRHKFRVAAWKFCTYALMSALGAYLLIWRQEPWVLSQRDYFAGWPAHPISTGVKTYYSAG